MRKQTILKGMIAACIFLVGVWVGKNLQEVLQERAANALAIEMMEQELLKQEQEKVVTVQPQDEVDVSENETASGNETTSENQISNNGYKPTWNTSYVNTEEFQSLETRLAIRSSYEETMLLNEEDREVITTSTLDFSNMTIACIGDSITEGYEGEVPYPEYLQIILGAKEVINLGIGGATFAKVEGVSSIADRAANYNEDIDLLIVMGGTNDNFYQSEGLFGSPYSDYNSEATFCGGLEWLMMRRKSDHPDIPVLYIMPPSNSLIDDLQADKTSLIEQEKYAEAYRVIGAEQGATIIDLYDLNFLNSHDATIQSEFMIDQVHFNSLGNKMLAERIASEIIVRYME